MNYEHPIWQDLSRVAFSFGAGKRFRRGGGGRMRDFAEIWGAGPRQGWPGEPRARRGDVKYSILEVIAEQPRHGYDVIKELEGRRGGGRPSAGSVYPTLQMLEDEGCVTSQTVDGKRIYTITDAGRTMLAQKPADAQDEHGRGEEWAGRHELKDSAFRLGAAVWQAARDGDPAVLLKVKELLDRARREVYALLGGDLG